MLLPVRRPHSSHQLTSDFATAKAILNFYDLPNSVRSLSLYLGQHHYGTLVTELAICLLHHGVLPTLITANPSIFERAAWNTFQLKKHGKTAIEEFQINEFVRAVEAGVLLRPEVPTEEMIDESLRHHHPVVVSLNHPSIRDTLGSDVEYGIITGYDSDSYTLVDFGQVGRARRFPKQVVIFALHAVAAEDPTSGAILLTAPLKPTT